MAPRKKIEKKTEIKGSLNFAKADPHQARFTISEDVGKAGRKLLGPGAVQLSNELFPADFEKDKYEVSASFLITVTIKEK